MSDTDQHPITEQSLQAHPEALGAHVMTRSGRNEHYAAPRKFSFEVKALFDNGLGLHILARQHNYRDPREAAGTGLLPYIRPLFEEVYILGPQ